MKKFALEVDGFIFNKYTPARLIAQVGLKYCPEKLKWNIEGQTASFGDLIASVQETWWVFEFEEYNFKDLDMLEVKP